MSGSLCGVEYRENNLTGFGRNVLFSVANSEEQALLSLAEENQIQMELQTDQLQHNIGT